MFAERFSENPDPGRTELRFRHQLSRTGDIKDEWSFISDETLRANIACTLQNVQFDVLLANNYNVFWSPLKMRYKHAVVQAASVAEAALQYMLQMIEDHPRVQKVLGHKWTWLDFNNVPLGGRIELPDDQRVVSGIQQKLQNVLDRNTKMKFLIRAAKAAEIVDDALAEQLDGLREARNRIHIKALTEPEYDQYSATEANEALNTLESFREVAREWTVRQCEESMQEALATRLPAAEVAQDVALCLNDVVEHETLGEGVVVAAEPGDVVTVLFFRDASRRRLMVQYARLRKTGALTPEDDDIPF